MEKDWAKKDLNSSIWASPNQSVGALDRVCKEPKQRTSAAWCNGPVRWCTRPPPYELLSFSNFIIQFSGPSLFMVHWCTGPRAPTTLWHAMASSIVGWHVAVRWWTGLVRYQPNKECPSKDPGGTSRGLGPVVHRTGLLRHSRADFL